MKLVATDEKVQIKWFVWTCGEKFPKTSNMRGEWGYDAQCSCGYETRTGGATRTCVQQMINDHKFYDHDYQYSYERTESIYESIVRRLNKAGA